MRQSYSLEVNRSLSFDNFTSTAFVSGDHVILFGQDGAITKANLEDSSSTQLLSNLEIGVSCVDQLLQTTEQVENKTPSLIGCVDGSVKLLSPETYGVNTSFSAHGDCISAAVWNKHGTSFLTASMDGMVKLWSSKGALRSTLMRLEAPVLDVSWGHDSSHIAFCSRSDLFVIDLRQQRTSKKWSPHSSAILRVEWSPVELVLLSGGDDHKFCLHDSTGERLYISEDLPWSISSLAWASHGQSFCLAAGRILLIYSLKAELLVQMELERECIHRVMWNLEQDRIVALGVRRLHILDLKSSIDEQCISEQYWDRLRNALCPVSNKNSTFCEIVAISQEYDFLVAATEKQCVVLPKKSTEELHLIDLVFRPKILLQSPNKLLILFETGEVIIYSYNGLRVCSFQLPNKSGKYITKDQISMNDSQLAALDTSTSRRIVFFDAETGDLQTSQDYGMRIASVCLCQECVQNGCLGVCVSEKRELFLFNSLDGFLLKLENFVSDVQWHSHEDSLAVIVNRDLVIWYLVSHYSDNRYLVDSLKQTILRGVEEGTTIDEFQGSSGVLSSRSLGSRHLSLNPAPRFLNELTTSGKWKEALLLCRKLEDLMLWRFLGALAIIRDKEDVKTICMTAIGEVEYLNYIMKD